MMIQIQATQEMKYMSVGIIHTDIHKLQQKKKKKILIPKERQIFNRNKISNINIKLKQQILPVNKQVRFTFRNAL